jgi:hypothetical protein
MIHLEQKVLYICFENKKWNKSCPEKTFQENVCEKNCENMWAKVFVKN